MVTDAKTQDFNLVIAIQDTYVTTYNSALWWQGDIVPEITKRLFQIRKNKGDSIREKTFKVWLGGQVKSWEINREIPESVNTERKVHAVRRLPCVHGIKIHCRRNNIKGSWRPGHKGRWEQYNVRLGSTLGRNGMIILPHSWFHMSIHNSLMTKEGKIFIPSYRQGKRSENCTDLPKVQR